MKLIHLFLLLKIISIFFVTYEKMKMKTINFHFHFILFLLFN
jgi:hypothetical protein